MFPDDTPVVRQRSASGELIRLEREKTESGRVPVAHRSVGGLNDDPLVEHIEQAPRSFFGAPRAVVSHDPCCARFFDAAHRPLGT